MADNYPYPSLPPESIESLRQLIHNYISEIPPEKADFLHEEVHARIPQNPQESFELNHQNPNWMLRRLLYAAKKPLDPESALEKFKEIFAYRKDYHILYLIENGNIAREFYQLNPIFIGGRDRGGSRLLVIRIKFYQKVPQFDLLVKHLILYYVEQQDREYEAVGGFKGLTMIMDCQDFNYRHANLDLVHFLVTMGFKYHSLIHKVIVHDLAWPLTFIYSLVEKLINANLTQSIGHQFLFSTHKETIHELIEPENLPEFLPKGQIKLNKVPPEGAATMEEIFLKDKIMSKLVEEKNAIRIHEYVQKLLQKK